MSLIEEVNRIIKEKEKELDTLAKELEAAYIFRDSIEKEQKAIPKRTSKIESGVSENQELIEAVKKKKRQKKKNKEVIEYIARQIMDSNRRFKVTEVKNIMVAAGYFSKNLSKAYNNVSTPLKRSNILKQVGAGIYELIDESVNQ